MEHGSPRTGVRALCTLLGAPHLERRAWELLVFPEPSAEHIADDTPRDPALAHVQAALLLARGPSQGAADALRLGALVREAAALSPPTNGFAVPGALEESVRAVTGIVFSIFLENPGPRADVQPSVRLKRLVELAEPPSLPQAPSFGVVPPLVASRLWGVPRASAPSQPSQPQPPIRRSVAQVRSLVHWEADAPASESKPSLPVTPERFLVGSVPNASLQSPRTSASPATALSRARARALRPVAAAVRGFTRAAEASPDPLAQALALACARAASELPPRALLASVQERNVDRESVRALERSRAHVTLLARALDGVGSSSETWVELAQSLLSHADSRCSLVGLTPSDPVLTTLEHLTHAFLARLLVRLQDGETAVVMPSFLLPPTAVDSWPRLLSAMSPESAARVRGAVASLRFPRSLRTAEDQVQLVNSVVARVAADLAADLRSASALRHQEAEWMGLTDASPGEPEQSIAALWAALVSTGGRQPESWRTLEHWEEDALGTTAVWRIGSRAVSKVVNVRERRAREDPQEAESRRRRSEAQRYRRELEALVVERRAAERAAREALMRQADAEKEREREARVAAVQQLISEFRGKLSSAEIERVLRIHSRGWEAGRLVLSALAVTAAERTNESDGTSASQIDAADEPATRSLQPSQSFVDTFTTHANPPKESVEASDSGAVEGSEAGGAAGSMPAETRPVSDPSGETSTPSSLGRSEALVPGANAVKNLPHPLALESDLTLDVVPPPPASAAAHSVGDSRTKLQSEDNAIEAALVDPTGQAAVEQVRDCQTTAQPADLLHLLRTESSCELVVGPSDGPGALSRRLGRGLGGPLRQLHRLTEGASLVQLAWAEDLMTLLLAIKRTMLLEDGSFADALFRALERVESPLGPHSLQAAVTDACEDAAPVVQNEFQPLSCLRTLRVRSLYSRLRLVTDQGVPSSLRLGPGVFLRTHADGRRVCAEFDVPPALRAIVSDSALAALSDLHGFLASWRWTRMQLSQRWIAWQRLHRKRDAYLPHLGCFFRMHAAVTTLLHIDFSFALRVVGAVWDRLIERLARARTVAEARAAHDSYVEELWHECLLDLPTAAQLGDSLREAYQALNTLLATALESSQPVALMPSLLARCDEADRAARAFFGALRGLARRPAGLGRFRHIRSLLAEA